MNTDDFFAEYRQQFDNEEPRKGHFKRFENKLQASQSATFFFFRKQTFQAFLVAASLVLFIAIGTLLVYDSNSSKSATSYMSLSDLSDEYAEVELYFQISLKGKIEELKNLNCSAMYNTENEIFNDIKELDSLYISLGAELKENTADERIINAMINCHKSKVEIVNHVIKQIQKNC